MQPRFDNAKVASIVSKLQAQVKQLQEEIESLREKEIFYLEQSKAKVVILMQILLLFNKYVNFSRLRLFHVGRRENACRESVRSLRSNCKSLRQMLKN